MIVLDTNVLSEIMRANPDENVLTWLDSQYAHDLHITSITVSELLYGVARLAHGKRKTALRGAIESMLDGELAGKVLAFDETAARCYAILVAQGRPISSADAQIAAICHSRDAVLATRNGKDFEATGVAVIDPWTAA
ncbi:plasmid stabilization protein [Burkholderia sp. PAMC 28687]|uniref:type II toxin-antitoxin system VapC family toxin n=1 Tax=Burkholderia sp. PAMC 28687 TaxID=1795874 RepID=UPI0007827AB1|nr:type II toxin-antitoxin system VapC family toxin [Burkholderia sp. PAMC 28687]AMM13032.1 plasmid stabilization protein [Burkholderia sp. PAMC 28687]